MRKFTIAAFTCVLVSSYTLMSLSHADTPANTPANSQSQLGDRMKGELIKLALTNESFVEKAALAGQTEIALSKLAMDRSSNGSVQAFAQRMIKDHTAASEQLERIAKSKNISVPKGLDEDHQSTVIRVGKYTGTEFDNEYNKQMQKDHDTAVTLFSAAASDDKLDPQLREFATKTLPTLRDHQHDAHLLESGKSSPQ